MNQFQHLSLQPYQQAFVNALASGRNTNVFSSHQAGRRSSLRRCVIQVVELLVADYYDIRPADFYLKTRARRVSRPRQVLWRTLAEVLSFPLAEIRRVYGVKYTAVKYAVRVVNAVCQVDPAYREQVQTIERYASRIQFHSPTKPNYEQKAKTRK